MQATLMSRRKVTFEDSFKDLRDSQDVEQVKVFEFLRAVCDGDVKEVERRLCISPPDFKCLKYEHIENVAQAFINSKKTKSILRTIIKEYTHSKRWPCQRSDLGSTDTKLKTIGKVVNWLTDHQLPSLYKDNTRKLFPIRELFFLAVLDHRTELADLLWKHLNQDFIAASIMASFLMKFISAKLKNHEAMFNLSRQLLERADEYETRAANILEECYEGNPEMAHLLLVRSLDGWDNRTVFSLAFAGEHKHFLMQDCCQQKLIKAWYGAIPGHTTTTKIALGIVCPLIVTYSQVRPLCSKSVKEFFSIAFHDFYDTPIVKFSTYTLSYVAFLCIFSVFLLTQLRPGDFSIYEYLVWVWASSIYVDELRQLAISVIKVKSLNPYKIEYFDSWWNFYDQILFGLIVLAIIFRFTLPVENFDGTADVYALAYVLYMLRILQNFYVIQAIGPKIEIIYRMLKDLCFFLLLFLLFILAFGIAFQSLVHPPSSDPQLHLNQDFTSNVFRHILYIPYFVIFQQFDDIKDQISNCVDSNYTDLSSDVQFSRCSGLATAFYLVYILITSLLLVNLLIATFSSSYNKVEESAEQTWLYHRFEIISEYIEKPTLAPPLTLLNHIWRLFKFCRKMVIRRWKRHKEKLGETAATRQTKRCISVRYNLQNIKSLNDIETEMRGRVDTMKLERMKSISRIFKSDTATREECEAYLDFEREGIYDKLEIVGGLEERNELERNLLKMENDMEEEQYICEELKLERKQLEGLKTDLCDLYGQFLDFKTFCDFVKNACSIYKMNNFSKLKHMEKYFCKIHAIHDLDELERSAFEKTKKALEHDNRFDDMKIHLDDIQKKLDEVSINSVLRYKSENHKSRRLRKVNTLYPSGRTSHLIQ